MTETLDRATPILFPLVQPERASQSDVNQLLPRRLYAELSTIIQAAIPKRDSREDPAAEFYRLRRHDAALVQGGRGAGKSTVLVNLPRYLQVSSPEVFENVHVLKPVDPTQLEDHEDLFLNVIVAAVMTDETLAKALDSNDSKRRILYQRLQELGQSLEDRQTRRDDAGIDRLRAFMGSHQLALAVHNFFDAALAVLGRKLLVLPLDDVDTTLHRAFENLEVVRRYLSSPLVFPVICGELELYHEVIRRDVLGRLTRDDRRPPDEHCVGIADGLAIEYERKLLPMQNRLQMPEVDTYLSDSNILIAAPDKWANQDALSMAEFQEWLYALLMGPVNGLENSQLELPVPTVRALSQLIGSVKEQMPDLVSALMNSPFRGSPRGVGRALQMPEVNPAALHAFELAQQDARSKGVLNSRSANTNFALAQGGSAHVPSAGRTLNDIAGEWYLPLLRHFLYEPKAGAACLVLLAHEHWRPRSLSDGVVDGEFGVLDTPLFKPMEQGRIHKLAGLERRGDLRPWREQLAERLPADGLARLPEEAILAFATPEAGRAVSQASRIHFNEEEVKDPRARARLNLIVDLALHKDYYSASKRAPLLLTGRILELIVTGLVRDINRKDIARLLAFAPYHSAGAVAPTKTLIVERDEDEMVTVEVEAQVRKSPEGLAADELVDRINRWRLDSGATQSRPSPWLMYNALNKALNQAWYFNRPGRASVTTALNAREIVQIARMAFDSFWSAVGGFEKGRLFGLPPIVSTVNVSTGEAFRQSDLYRQNISPFRSSRTEAVFGRLSRSTTFQLGEHPLRKWFDELPTDKAGQQGAVPTGKPRPSTPKEAREVQAKRWLRERLGGSPNASQLGLEQLRALIARSGLSVNALKKLARELDQKFADSSQARERLAQVVAEMSKR